MPISERKFRQILREESTRLFEDQDRPHSNDIEDVAEEAENVAEEYGLGGINWNGVITTLVGSGATAGLDATGAGVIPA